MLTKSKILLAAAVASVASFASVTAALPAFADEPSATVSFSGGRVGFLVGYSWANGVLHYQGRDYPIRVQGVSGGELGAAKFDAEGEVYNLAKASDFAGKYDVLSAGATIIGGGSGVIEENQQGVKMRLRTRTNGLNVNFAIEGARFEFKEPVED